MSVVPAVPNQVQVVEEFGETFEYDDYYNTRVNDNWGDAAGPIFTGVSLIFLGIGAIIVSAIDLFRGASINPRIYNPNYVNILNPTGESSSLAGSWHENSLWPTIGKGIWVGIIMLVTGIIALISKCDASRIGVHIFNILAWTTMILSLFLVLSSALTIGAYPYNALYNNDQRTTPQNIEVSMNAILIAIGSSTFLISMFSAISSCIALDYCTNGRVNPKYSRNGVPFN